MTKFNIETGSETDKKVCDLILGWNKYETDNDGSEFQDFNLPRYKGRKEYTSRREINSDIQKLLDQEDVQSCPITFSRIISLDAYMRNLTSTTPVNLIESQYDAMGISLQPIPKHIQESAYNDALEALDAANFTFDDYENELNMLQPVNAATLKQDLEAVIQNSRHTIQDIVGQTARFNTTLDIIEDNPTRLGEITGNGRDFRVVINALKIKNFVQPRHTIQHEILGHGIHYSLIADAIERGERPLHAGVTTVIGTEGLIAEAIADRIPAYLDRDNPDPYIQVYTKMHRYRRLLANNIIYNVQHDNTEAAHDIIQKFAPKCAHKTSHNYIDACQNSPIYRVYLGIYGAVNNLFALAQEQLSNEAYKSALRDLYTLHCEPEDINRIFQERGFNDPTALLNTDSPNNSPKPSCGYMASPEM